MPDRARPFALGWLQALSAVGNMLAAVCGIGLGKLEESGAIGSAWRVMFLIGLAPALLAIPIFLRLKEPERWKAAAKEEEQELAADPKHAQARLARRAVRRPALAAEHDRRHGPGLRRRRRPLGHRLLQLRPDPHASSASTSRPRGSTRRQIAGKLTFWTGITSLVQNAGAFFGIYAFA